MFSVRMPKEQAIRLEEKARQIGVSKTALVLMWIDQMLMQDARIQKDNP